MSWNKENKSLSDLMKIIESKPEIPLSVGAVFRNEEEIDDIEAVIEKSPKAILYGVAGGRNRENTFLYSLEDLADLFNVSSDDPGIEKLQEWIISNALTVPGITLVNSGDFGLPDPVFSLKSGLHLFSLIRDIDIVIMDDKLGGKNTQKNFPGKQSGTIIDVFTITPEIALGGLYRIEDEMYVNLFNEVSRLRF